MHMCIMYDNGYMPKSKSLNRQLLCGGWVGGEFGLKVMFSYFCLETYSVDCSKRQFKPNEKQPHQFL